MDPSILARVKLLVDPVRLRIVGRLAAGAANTDELATGLGLDRAEVVRNVDRLRSADLVAVSADGRVELRLDALMALGRELDTLQRQAEHRATEAFAAGAGVPADEARVLRAFIVDGRLATIPAAHGKRLVVLRYLRDQCFTEDRGYPEKEVNQRLALFHPDVAALRRYMVDAHLMTRDGGEYRRPADDIG